MARLDKPSELRAVLAGAREVAVLGISDRRQRAGYYVPEYLHQQGYGITGVNPHLAGTILFGRPVVATLGELDTAVDIVDVFRRIEALADHIPEILAMQPHPRVVWLQSGLHHEAMAQRLSDAGIDVVEDRCMLAEHRRLGPFG